MPKIKMRRRARLIVEGREVNVETNAVDFAKAEREGEGGTVMTLRLLHHAAMRQRVEGVPIKFETFLAQLDEFETDDDDDDLGGDDGADPTHRRDSERSP